MKLINPPDFGKDIRDMRKSKNMTLEQLEEASGVSKSVLSQIERGQTNPTVSTLWNIAQALGIEPGDLFRKAEDKAEDVTKIEILTSGQTPVIVNEACGYRLTILNTPDQAGKREIYRLQMAPKGVLDSAPHEAGAHEQLTVLSGKVDLACANAHEIIHTGDTARYRADVSHRIAVHGSKSVDAILLVNFY